MSRHSLQLSRRGAGRLLTAVGLFALMLPMPMEAFDPSASPATSVPPERYPGGELRPIAILGDTTDFDFSDDSPGAIPFYYDVDAEGSPGAYYLFAAAGRGMEIYDITNPDAPQLRSFTYGFTELPFWPSGDLKLFLRTVDAPPGVHTVVAMGGLNAGMVIWNTANKFNPSLHYQDQGAVNIGGVWSMQTQAGRNYAIAADMAGGSGGFKLYDLDSATDFADCLENSGLSIACPGVFRGQMGSNKVLTAVDGVASETDSKRFVAGRWTVTQTTFVEIWDVSDPLIAVLPGATPRLTGSFPTLGFTHDIAMWETGGVYYLAGLKSDEVNIFDVSCIAGGGACTLGAPIATIPVPENTNLQQEELTFGHGGGTPYLYVGNTGVGSMCAPQREYLLDVTAPIKPSTADVTPEPIIDINDPDGPSIGYWGWYYGPCTSGFNNVTPRRMAFHPDRSERIFYRAAYSVLDSHEVGASPAPPLFVDGFESGTFRAWTTVVPGP